MKQRVNKLDLDNVNLALDVNEKALREEIRDGRLSAQTSIGEVVTATVGSGSAVSLVSSIGKDVTSVILTPGDWDCTGVVGYSFAATTSYTWVVAAINTTSNTIGTAGVNYAAFTTPAAVPTAATFQEWITPRVRISIAATTTVYLIARAIFTVSTLDAFGSILCRKVREL